MTNPVETETLPLVDLIAQLRRVAMNATPEEWKTVYNTIYVKKENGAGLAGQTVAMATFKKDVEYIAAACPLNVIRLVEALERQKEEGDRLEAWLDHNNAWDEFNEWLETRDA
jgi:TusA-related sulfurtransferase